MTGDEYLIGILQKYAVQTGVQSPVMRAFVQIAPVIRTWATTWLSTLTLSGSYAKGTAVATGTDADIFISLKSDAPGTLRDIYNSLFQLAQNNDWFPRKQNVSIRSHFAGLPLDLVPGRIQQGYQNYHSLYRSKVDSWTQTNVSLHIQTVSNSGRTPEIRVLKIWRDIHGITFPSFYLELFVINTLRNRRTGRLAENVLFTLNELATTIESVRIDDPANSNNIISDDLTGNEKRVVAQAAATALKQVYWSNIIW